MIQTPNLQLEKYELDDAANLSDGYNNSMDKIDAYAGTINAKFPITGADIADGSINTVDIANGAITEVKLAADAVTQDKIAPGSVAESELSESVNNTLAKVVTNETLVEEHVNYFTALGVTDEQSADDLHTQIDNTYQAAMSNTQSIELLNRNVAPHVVIFGDSWSDTNPETTVYTKWPLLFAKQTHATIHNYAKNGAKVSKNDNNPGLNGDILGQLTTAKSDTSFNHAYVDIVIVEGGLNDYNQDISADDCGNGLVLNLKSIAEEFPNARIIYCLNHPFPVTRVYWTWALNVIPIVNLAGYTTFNMIGWVNFANQISDHLHPNNIGYEQIAANMLAVCYGGQPNYVHEKINVIPSPIVTAKYIIIEQWFDNNKMFGYVQSSFNSAKDVNESISVTGLLCSWIPYTFCMGFSGDAVSNLVAISSNSPTGLEQSQLINIKSSNQVSGIAVGALIQTQ